MVSENGTEKQLVIEKYGWRYIEPHSRWCYLSQGHGQTRWIPEEDLDRTVIGALNTDTIEEAQMTALGKKNIHVTNSTQVEEGRATDEDAEVSEEGDEMAEENSDFLEAGAEGIEDESETEGDRLEHREAETLHHQPVTKRRRLC